MGLTKAEKDKLKERVKSLSKDELEGLREALDIPLDIPGDADLRATIEVLQKEMLELKGMKKEEPGIFERLFGFGAS